MAAKLVDQERKMKITVVTGQSETGEDITSDRQVADINLAATDQELVDTMDCISTLVDKDITGVVDVNTRYLIKE